MRRPGSPGRARVRGMATPLLATKLYVPPLRRSLVRRSHLLERLDRGLRRKLTLVSAPAGFGKTTLLSEWVADRGQSEPQVRIAWLSLDAGDNDPARFLTYLLAALRQVEPSVGGAAELMLQAPQPPPPESLLTSLINDIAAIPVPCTLVLDDYHSIQALPIHQS